MLEGMAGFTLLHSWLQESKATPEESQAQPEEFQTPSQNSKTSKRQTQSSEFQKMPAWNFRRPETNSKNHFPILRRPFTTFHNLPAESTVPVLNYNESIMIYNESIIGPRAIFYDHHQHTATHTHQRPTPSGQNTYRYLTYLHFPSLVLY